MDANFKNLLKKEGKNAIIDQDPDWNQCALVRVKKVDQNKVDLGSLGDTLLLSATLA